MPAKNSIENSVDRINSNLVYMNAKQRYQERIIKNLFEEVEEARKTSNFALVFSACSLALSLGLVASVIIF